MPDYEAEDRALDEEIRGLYSSNDQDNDSLEESSTESESTETETELDQDSTPEPVDDKTESEPVVAESRYKEAVRAMNEAQRELANERKQNAERDNLVKQLQAQIDELKQSKQETNELEGSDLDSLREDYPEIIDPLFKVIDDLKKQLADVKSEVYGVKSTADRYQQQEAVTAKEKWRQAVKDKHADLEDLEKAPEFWDWANKQPPVIQYALQQGTAEDAIAALNLYRAENPKSVPATNKVDKLASARQAASPNVKSGGKPDKKLTFTHKQIDKMSREEFVKHEAAIDEALVRGEITY